tara:strand:- start:1524 stop:1826 length:303 start_codon:yes stop_codon:yes gene_type:complete
MSTRLFDEKKISNIQKEFYRLRQEFLNTQELFKRENNRNRKVQLMQKVLRIDNNMKKVNKEYGKALDNIKAKESKERMAFKRKLNNAFNSPVKNKKLAKK